MSSSVVSETLNYKNLCPKSLVNTSSDVSNERSKFSNETGMDESSKLNSTMETVANSSTHPNNITPVDSEDGTVEDLRNLIVNYLPPSYDEQKILGLFGTIGKVESCKLIRDKSTGQSLGYAFVKFEEKPKAKEAMQKFNGMYLEDKIIKVSVARKSRPEIRAANLYVGGLPYDTTEIQLKELFSTYGQIISCRVIPSTEKSPNYHYGFIRFDTRREAQQAMECLHGKVPPVEILPTCTNTLIVKFARTPNVVEEPQVLDKIDPYFEMMNSYYPIPSSAPLDKFKQDNCGSCASCISSKILMENDMNSNAACLPMCGRLHASYLQSIGSKNQDSNTSSNNSYDQVFPSLFQEKISIKKPKCAKKTLILVGLPYDVNEEEIYKLCSIFGKLHKVVLINEENTIVGIVQMDKNLEAKTAQKFLQNFELRKDFRLITMVI